MSPTLSLADRPFYAPRLDAHGRPHPWDLADLEDFAAESGDPFAGRRRPDAEQPALSLQLETCDDPPVWVGLDARELEAWSRPLEGIWARYGLAPGECIALFEYGSSPLAFLASSSWTPHLRRGAADRLGVRAICNDGVASLSERMVDIVERLHPAALVVRRDVIAPFAEALEFRGAALADCCRWVAICEPEGTPRASEATRAREAWGVPVRRILRADAALVLAGECGECDAFHVSRRHYRVEALEGDAVAVTTRFARICPSVRHRMGGFTLLSESCPVEPDAQRIAAP